MSTRDRLALAGALAVLLACAALVPVYDGLGWLVRVAGGVLVVVAAATAARYAGVPRALHPLAGLLGLAAHVCLVFAAPTLAYGLLPTGETLSSLRTTVGEGLLDVEALAPPVPTTPGLVLLAVLGAGAIAVVVDTLAVTLRQAAAAGLPLLLLFAVPSAVLPGGLGVVPFVAGAAGWLGLLLADSSDTVSRWGAPLQSRRAAAAADPSLNRVGRRIGVAALGVAVVVPALVPGLDARLLGGGDGDGFGGGSRSVTTYNPITRLAGQLSLPEPRELLRYTTDARTPDYLRLTTLDRFDEDAGWSSSELSGDPDEDRAQDGTPIDGQSLPGSGAVQVGVELSGELDGPWLPLPFPPDDVDVEGPWLWDEEAETVFSTRTSLADLEEPYTVTATRLEPTVDQLRRAGTVPEAIADTYAQPPELSPYVRDEISRVTDGETTSYDKVAALQRYFLEDPRFVYDEDASAPPISSGSALEDFLRDGTGYCEQYASAMAAMVRGLGIPARVAVGFTPGREVAGAYVVTTSEAHAWPEVWFPGAGWTRFEPTPRTDQQTSVPEYSEAPEEAPAGPTPSAAPTAAPSVAPAAPEETLPEDRAAQDGVSTVADDEDGGSSRWLLLVPAVLLLLAAPWLLSRFRARRRWRAAASPAAGARTAWAAVADDAVDVGHRWRPMDSPRAAAAHLLAVRPLPVPAADALHRLAAGAERARYARPASPGTGAGAGSSGAGSSGTGSSDVVGDLRRDVATVRTALLGTTSGRTRLTARLAPPSTLRWASAGLGTAVADLLDRVDTVVTAVGAKLRHPRSRRA